MGTAWAEVGAPATLAPLDHARKCPSAASEQLRVHPHCCRQYCLKSETGVVCSGCDWTKPWRRKSWGVRDLAMVVLVYLEGDLSAPV